MKLKADEVYGADGVDVSSVNVMLDQVGSCAVPGS